MAAIARTRNKVSFQVLRFVGELERSCLFEIGRADITDDSSEESDQFITVTIYYI